MSIRDTVDNLAPVLNGNGDYPRRWEDHIGQEQAKKMLRLAARSSRLRKEPMPHVLIAHPTPGIGKSSLAQLIAKELRHTCRVVSGQVSAGKARLVLSEMRDGDVLLYDEFHQILDNGKKAAEWTLHFLQDGTITGPLGPEPQPKVTLIAATTDAGRLPDTIVSRFPLKPLLDEYTVQEAAKICKIMARRVLPEGTRLPPKDTMRLATAANCNPRRIRALLVVLRDLLITGEMTKVDVTSLLEFQGITHDGLDRVAQQYLTLLALEFHGAAGAKALEDRLSQPGGLTSTERLLMDKGLVARTRTGRALTQAGLHRVRELEG